MRFWFSVIFVNQIFSRSTPTARIFDQDRERHLLAAIDNTVEKKFFSFKRGEEEWHWRREKTATVAFHNFLNS